MSPTSVCYTVAKVEGDLGSPASVLGTAASSFQFGIRKHPDRVSMSSAPLKVSKDSHRIRKPPLPLPQVQYRPPIIIHTYSPKVIHTQPHDFMLLVQKLTGSSDTRLRLKRSPSSAKKLAAKASNSSDRCVTGDAYSTDLQHQGSGTKASSTQCGSPSSSSEDSPFAPSAHNSPEATNACAAAEPPGKQSTSPRSPFEASFDDLIFAPFDVKAEPSSDHFSFTDPSFNFFSDFTTTTTTTTSTSSAHPSRGAMKPYSPFHSIDINSPLPTPGSPFLSHSGLMPALPDLSSGAAAWPQSFFDSLSAPPPPPQRQGFYGGGYMPASEGTMVALENIQAFMLT